MEGMERMEWWKGKTGKAIHISNVCFPKCIAPFGLVPMLPAEITGSGLLRVRWSKIFYFIWTVCFIVWRPFQNLSKCCNKNQTFAAIFLVICYVLADILAAVPKSDDGEKKKSEEEKIYDKNFNPSIP